jgi:uracil-DNA glycosylase
MTADDLPAAFASLPAAWRDRLPGWTPELSAEVARRVREVSGAREIAPADPFRAFRLVDPGAVRAVILGQDPYPKAGQADGLAFSCGQGTPPSLRRIFEVLRADRPGFVMPGDGRLDAWARQGVLLLNTALTVEVGAGKAGSHMSCGWQALTSQVVAWLAQRAEPPVFMLWGKPANRFFDAAVGANARATVWRTRHPSYDFNGDFMADGSHFHATRTAVDWWALRTPPEEVL